MRHDWPGTGVVGAGCVMIGQEQVWWERDAS